MLTLYSLYFEVKSIDVGVLGAVVLFAVGLLSRFLPAEHINRFYGYRTPTSRENLQNWKIANRYFGALFLPLSAVLLLAAIVTRYVFKIDPFYLFLIGYVLIVSVCVGCVEYKLRKEDSQ